MSELTDFQTEVLRTLLRTRRVPKPARWPTYGGIAERMKWPEASAQAVGGALGPIVAWCDSRNCPDITVIVLRKSDKDKGNSIPPRALARYGSEEAVRDIQKRVHGFDWKAVEAP